MSIYIGTCPTCGGLVGKRADGHLADHKRYADGAGPGADLSHGLKPCEGSGGREAAFASRQEKR